MIVKRETEIEKQLEQENVDINSYLEFSTSHQDMQNTTKHCIVCADSLTYELKGICNPSLIFTSPPYNANIDYENYNDSLSFAEYCNFLESFIDRYSSCLQPHGRFVINIRDIKIEKGSRYPIIVFLYQQLCLQRHFSYRGVHIWYKGREESSTAWGSWKSSSNPSIIDLYEYIYVFQKPGPQIIGDDDITKEEFIESNLGIWKIRPVKKIFGSQRINKNLHPCPFPLELPYRIIKLYTHVGDWVVDPFGGIATTNIAAYLANRNSITIEINKKYCDVGFLLLKKYTKNCILI